MRTTLASPATPGSAVATPTPSTEVVAAEIGEEIVLVSLIMGLGIAADAPVVALAVAGGIAAA